MPAYIALLRGINVGKAKRVPMALLRDLLTELGCTEVATLLNSGNAVFQAESQDPAELAARIAAALTSKLDFEVPVIVKSAAELEAIVSGCPIAVDEADHARFLVAFAQTPQHLQQLTAIEALVKAPERFALGSDAAYLLCASGILESKAGEALLGKVGRKWVTCRNWATVLKLHALAGTA
ncbi:MAG: DUF1697 domain-containing protein [Lysobacterales bacterium]